MSATFFVAPKDLGKYEQRLASGVFRQAVRAAQNAAGRESVALLRKRTREARPASPGGGVGAVDRRRFLNGWVVESQGLTTTVGNTAPHAAFVEYGRRPGKPPPTSALRGWVRRKLGASGKAADALAFLVARAIGRRGLLGRYILEGAFSRISRLHTTRVDQILSAALRASK